MRSTLWSRAARPKLNGSSTSTSTAGLWRFPVVRQTTSGPVRRQITVNEVFTLLLTPILATALLADTSWKDKRRKDWTNRISELEAETEQIQSRATKSWQALQPRSLRLGAVQQHRQYSAVALRSQPNDEGDLILDQPEVGNQHLPLEEAEYEPAWFEATLKQPSDPATGPWHEPEQDSACFTPETVEKSERLRRLLAIKLALNLTIYLNTGVSPSKLRREIRIPDITPDLRYDPHEVQDLPKLLQRMRELCSTMKHLNQALPNGAIPVRNEMMNADSQKLQDNICALSARFEASSIALPEFITSYTMAVLKSPVPPTSKAYLALFRGLARGSSVDGPSHDLAMQTLFAWEQSRLPIGDHDLFVILTELARRKHVQKFDGLMRDLTMSPSPMNLLSRWTWEQANDIQVPVPKSYNPALLVTLIHCALRFDQPQKAEAWSEILRRTWIDVNDPTQKTPLQQVFTNWMRYCEVQGNWRRGVAWLDAAQKWAITVASFDMYSLQRLTIGMLSLCFACGKSREYEEILNAAVDSGIPSMNPRHFLERSSRGAICREWNHLHSAAYRYKHDTRTDQEKVQAFRGKVKAMAQRLLPDKDSADVQWRYEQKDKPNPLMADAGAQSSDQISAQAVALWQQIHAKSQEDLGNSRTAARKWQVQCTAQEKKLGYLKAEVEHQKKLVRELAAINTKAQPHNQIETEKRMSNKTDELLVSRPVKDGQQLDVAQQESDVVDKHKLSPSQPQKVEIRKIERDFAKNCDSSSVQPPRITPRRTGFQVADGLLLSRSESPRWPRYKEAEGYFSDTEFLLPHLAKA